MIKNLVSRLIKMLVSRKGTSVTPMYFKRVNVEKRMVDFIILLVGFLYYVVGVELSDDACLYIWFFTDNYSCYAFCHSLDARSVMVLLGEDKDNLVQVLIFLPKGKSYVFLLLCLACTVSSSCTFLD